MQKKKMLVGKSCVWAWPLEPERLVTSARSWWANWPGLANAPLSGYASPINVPRGTGPASGIPGSRAGSSAIGPRANAHRLPFYERFFDDFLFFFCFFTSPPHPSFFFLRSVLAQWPPFLFWIGSQCCESLAISTKLFPKAILLTSCRERIS